MSVKEDDLQRFWHKFQCTAKIFNMYISSAKTKRMTTAKILNMCKLGVEANIAQTKFKYLKIEISGKTQPKQRGVGKWEK